MPALGHEIYDPLYHTPQDNLYDVYQELRDEQPLYYNESRNVWAVSRYDDVRTLARDWERFTTTGGIDLDAEGDERKPYGAGNFLEYDPPRHDLLRKIARPFFIPKAIERLEPLVAGHVASLLDELDGRERIDLAHDFAWALPVWVICRMLGIPEADTERVHQLVTEMERREPGEEGKRDRAKAAMREMRAYTEEFAKDRRRNPGDDLMSHLVAAEARGELLPDEVIGMALLFFAAGSETTAALIGNTLNLLGCDEKTQSRLREQPAELIDAVVAESLRYESPVQWLPRQTTVPVELYDREVPAGADLVLLYGAANRDERRFDRPDAFDIDRPQERTLAFGDGIHFCIGAPLARLEARVAVPAFLRAIRSYEIDGPGDRSGVVPGLRGFTHLPAAISG